MQSLHLQGGNETASCISSILGVEKFNTYIASIVRVEEVTSLVGFILRAELNQIYVLPTSEYKINNFCIYPEDGGYVPP
jgi:hypothetical protein